MIFRQLFDSVSCTYTYLLSGHTGGEALIIDPVLEKVERYLQLLNELDLKLVKALDTHVHADHVSALGVLRDRTQCVTVMGQESAVDVVSMRVADGEMIEIDGLALRAIYTPGHTSDSYCFHLDQQVGDARVFTGDTLLIRGTGRTDFQNGDARAQYDSLFGKLLTLPGDTLVYPGHDYKGDTVSTIAEECAHNPRLQVGSADDYAEIMDHLGLDNPKMMDVAVPANLKVGLSQDEVAQRGWAIDCAELAHLLDRPGTTLIDLRDRTERARHGMIRGSLHVPYGAFAEYLGTGGVVRALADRPGTELVLYCAYGERSAMAVRAAHEVGLVNMRHLAGGIDAWKKSGGKLVSAPAAE